MTDKPGRDRDRNRRKWLVVIDETEECDRALTFAAYRVLRTGGTIVLLNIIEPDTFQHWLGVEDVMRAEAMEAAEKILQKAKARVADIGDLRVETVIREGPPTEEIEELIRDEKDIAILVLAASATSEGPGPLVTSITARGGKNAFPIPVAIVPGNLSDEELDALS